MWKTNELKKRDGVGQERQVYRHFSFGSRLPVRAVPFVSASQWMVQGAEVRTRRVSDDTLDTRPLRTGKEIRKGRVSSRNAQPSLTGTRIKPHRWLAAAARRGNI